MPAAKGLDEWKTVLRQRFDRQAAELGLKIGSAYEAFTVTAWGLVPTLERLIGDFPTLQRTDESDSRLHAKLHHWGV